MLSVTGIWLYIFFTTALLGYGILRVLTRLIPYRIRHGDSCLLCGLAAVTVYAQLFSLFGRVAMAANLLLVAVCVSILYCDRREIIGILRGTWNGISQNKSGVLERRGRMFIMVFLFFLFAYGTSRGAIHYDTGLYHAQSIRWLEEYGVVKGLGNLHCRLAYNSSSFALSALYSMAFLGGQSYHAAAGWLAFLLAKVCLELVDSLRARRLRASDFARVMGIYYLVNIFDEMISPASDYFMVLLAFFIVIRWLELLEKNERAIFPYAMLCVMGVFLMTVKLSAALILLLVCYPAFRLLRERRWKEVGIYLLMGSATALPYLIRNVLLSGWLVYPFTQIDLFDVRWKIPKGVADYDAREIQVWGRGYSDVTRYEISMKEWMPDWFRSLAGSDKLLVTAAMASVCILIVCVAGMLLGVCKRRWDILLVQVTVAGSFVFWLCTSPLIRYGCVYVYLTPAVILGGIYDAVLADDMTGKVQVSGMQSTGGGAALRKVWRESVKWCGLIGVVSLSLYKCMALGREIAASRGNDYWLVQKDYENYETSSYEIEGVTFYYPVNGDQVGYEDFPSAPVRVEIELMGEEVGDGFAAVRQ